jgi:acetyl esterase/lipase
MVRHFLFLILLATLVVVTASTAVAAELRPDIEYANVEGESLKLDASVPTGDGPFPIAILIHGGGWGGGDKAREHVPPVAPLINEEFTWFSINYRLAPTHRWPACIDDVRTAIRWVKEHAAEFKGDPKRVVLIGYSAGGHLAAYAATTADDATRPQALVVYAGPTDLEADCERRKGLSPSLQALFDHDVELDDAIRTKLRDASPLYHVSKKTPPTLLIHGTIDESVPYGQSVKFQAKLAEMKVPCDLITIPRGGHRTQEWRWRVPDYERQVRYWLHDAVAAAPSPATSSPATSQ